jgi:hypothetical protein
MTNNACSLRVESALDQSYVPSGPLSDYRRSFDADSNGTYLVGWIKATYVELAELFGEAEETDENKISGHWRFVDEDGNVFTLYDWKKTNLYAISGPSVEEFRKSNLASTFNIGGKQNTELNCNFMRWLETKLYWHRTNKLTKMILGDKHD